MDLKGSLCNHQCQQTTFIFKSELHEPVHQREFITHTESLCLTFWSQLCSEFNSCNQTIIIIYSRHSALLEHYRQVCWSRAFDLILFGSSTQLLLYATITFIFECNTNHNQSNPKINQDPVNNG